MPFNANEPADTLYQEVDSLANIAENSKLPYSDEQHIDFVNLILQQAIKFKSDLKAWNSKPVAEKTWANFKK